MTEANSTIAITQQDDVTILTILLDEIRQYETSAQMSKEFKAAIEGNQKPRVVIDMSNVAFMSSVAYLPFVSLRSSVSELDGVMVLCNFSESIEEMFKAARLLVNPRSPSAPFLFADSIPAAVDLARGESV